MVETRIDEARDRTRRRLATSSGVVEEITTLLGGSKHECGCQEDGWLDCALRKRRIVAISQHERLRMQDVICQSMPMIARFLHGPTSIVWLSERARSPFLVIGIQQAHPRTSACPGLIRRVWIRRAPESDTEPSASAPRETCRRPAAR